MNASPVVSTSFSFGINSSGEGSGYLSKLLVSLTALIFGINGGYIK